MKIIENVILLGMKKIRCSSRVHTPNAVCEAASGKSLSQWKSVLCIGIALKLHKFIRSCVQICVLREAKTIFCKFESKKRDYFLLMGVKTRMNTPGHGVVSSRMLMHENATLFYTVILLEIFTVKLSSFLDMLCKILYSLRAYK